MWLSFKVRNENEMYGYADGFQKYSTQEFTLCFYSTYPIVWYIIFPCLRVKLTIRPDIVVPILRIQLFWFNKPFTFITGVIWNKIENDFYIWGELNKNIGFCIIELQLILNDIHVVHWISMFLVTTKPA